MSRFAPRPDHGRRTGEPSLPVEPLDEAALLDEAVLAGELTHPLVEAADPATRELAEGLAMLAARVEDVEPDPAFMEELALFTRAASPSPTPVTRPRPVRRLVAAAALVPVAAALAFFALAGGSQPSPAPVRNGVITLTHERPTGTTGATGATGPSGPSGITTPTVPEGVQSFDAAGNPIPAPTASVPSPATPGVTTPGTPTP